MNFSVTLDGQYTVRAAVYATSVSCIQPVYDLIVFRELQ